MKVELRLGRTRTLYLKSCRRHSVAFLSLTKKKFNLVKRKRSFFSQAYIVLHKKSTLKLQLESSLLTMDVTSTCLNLSIQWGQNDCELKDDLGCLKQI